MLLSKANRTLLNSQYSSLSNLVCSVYQLLFYFKILFCFVLDFPVAFLVVFKKLLYVLKR